MFIARLSLVLTFLLFSCAKFNTQEITNNIKPCSQKRGAIDIGSGTSKLVVAVVDTCKAQITNILFEAQRAIGFKEDLANSKENMLSKSIQDKARENLEELMYLARKQGASEISAVATSAFRTAKNGKEVATYLSNVLNIRLRVISQTDEALFAYNSAVSKFSKNNEAKKSDIVVWDIGGGSMQIISPSQDSKKIYLGKLASVSFKNEVLKLKKSKKNSPNPLGDKIAIDSMNFARKYANRHAKPILKTLKNKVVLGVGGVHYYSIKGQLKNFKYAYEQNQLLESLLERANFSDKKVGGKYASTDVTNLSLVLGFMQSLNIEKVVPLKINMAHGLLITKSYWK